MIGREANKIKWFKDDPKSTFEFIINEAKSNPQEFKCFITEYKSECVLPFLISMIKISSNVESSSRKFFLDQVNNEQFSKILDKW